MVSTDITCEDRSASQTGVDVLRIQHVSTQRNEAKVLFRELEISRPDVRPVLRTLLTNGIRRLGTLEELMRVRKVVIEAGVASKSDRQTSKVYIESLFVSADKFLARAVDTEQPGWRTIVELIPCSTTVRMCNVSGKFEFLIQEV